ncbi:MAG TPA: thiol reductant ABC exporter subunit CydC [Nevskiaceae bacterium]
MKDLFRLLRLGHSARGRFALGAALALVVVLANVALLGLAGWFIAAMAAAGLIGASMNYFTPSAGIRAFALMRTVGRYAERVVNHDATLRLLSRLRVWVYARVQPLAPAVLGHYRKGDVLTRLVANVDALDNAWLRIFSPVIVAACSAAAVLAFLAFHSPAVAWVDLVLLACVGVLLPVAAQRMGRRHAERAASVEGEVKAALTEELAGIGELTICGGLPAVAARVERASDDWLREQRAGLSLETAAAALTVLVSGVAITLTWWFAAPGVLSGAMSPLVLPLLVFVVLASVEGVQGLPAAFRVLDDTLAAARRVFALADEQPAVTERVSPLREVQSSALRFEAVGFRYPGGARDAVADLTLDLPAGAAIALVGASGAGKSSIARLAMRFHDPQRGTVTLGGRPVVDYALEPLRRQFAWAGQSTRLFSTTIRENLRLAAPQADDERLWAALEATCLADEVRCFDAHLDHFVGAGGMALSAGQARRLCLARAWLSPAPILLLDEATEGLDPRAARAIVERFVDGRGHRSLLWVTHQALGLDRMDEVLVMDAGRVVARGSHQELLQRSGFYRDMASRIL